jgi:hypothetical protein
MGEGGGLERGVWNLYCTGTVRILTVLPGCSKARSASKSRQLYINFALCVLLLWVRRGGWRRGGGLERGDGICSVRVQLEF